MFSLFKKKSAASTAAIIISTAAIIGMIDSFFLVLEFIQVLLHPGEPTPCTVSTFVSCTLTVQGEFGHYIPGVPNPLWGMLWYSGLAAYGLTRWLGSEHSKNARKCVGAIILLGILFSYRLYLASIFQLGGVCPFCLLSTTLSTLIALAFVVDDLSYSNPSCGKKMKGIITLFQLFSVLFFVIGLPLFIGYHLSLLPEMKSALLHWSFSSIVLVTIVMGLGQYWAWKKRKGVKNVDKK
jgi:uncharacterized membrane protein